MKPLLCQLNEKETIKIVDEHIASFLQIRHFYQIDEVEEIYVPSRIDRKELAKMNMENRVLKKVVKNDYINKITKEYLDRMIETMNMLDKYDRELIFSRYFYEMDEEELCEKFGSSARSLWTDLKEAKIQLAYLLGCEQYFED